jgi:hypothetical protein
MSECILNCSNMIEGEVSDRFTFTIGSDGVIKDI